MGIRGGYAGNILKVDLSERQVTREPLSEELIARFLGGMGIGFKLAHDHIRPKEDALGPGNALIFNLGPFVGTNIPGASKCQVVAKSPSSGFLGISGSGHMGVLKFTGHDHLVITGKADQPSYLKITDEDVEICDARDLWGKDVWEATEAIWQTLGSQYVVACIGPGGENLACQANIITNKYSAFAQQGLGAVMGSKNLKAIALFGTRPIRVADPDRYETLVDELEAVIKGPQWAELACVSKPLGTVVGVPFWAKLGMYGYQNYRSTGPEKIADQFNPEKFLSDFKQGTLSCMSCPIGCKHLIRLNKRDFAGMTLPISCGAVPVHTFASYCGLASDKDGWEEVLGCAELCNRMGMDELSTSSVIGFAIDLYQEGVIDTADTKGLKLDWGAAETVQKLIKQIALRQGIGDVLAEGLAHAPERIGKNAAAYAVRMKGSQPITDPRRWLSAEMFSDLINRSGSTYHVGKTLMPSRWAMPKEQLRDYCLKVMGIPPDKVDPVLSGPQGFNPALFAKWGDDHATLYECLGQCQLYWGFEISKRAELYTALTGIEMSGEKLSEAAERVWDLRKVFDMREGRSRQDDSRLPLKFAKERLVASTGEVYEPVEEKAFDALLRQYYEERGWDPTEGTVSEAKRKALGL